MHTDKEHNKGEETSLSPSHFDILESLDHPVCVLGVDGILSFGNKSFRDIFKSENDIVRLDWEHPFFPEYRKRIAQSYLHALKGHKTKCFAILNAIDGKQLPVEIYLYPLRSDATITGILVFMHIVDARLLSFDRSTLSIISEDNFQYDAMYYEYSPEPLLRLNETGEIIKYSHSAESYLGRVEVESEEVAFPPIKSIFIYDAERIKNTVMDIFAGTTSFQRIGEVKIAAEDGSQKIAHIVLFPHVKENKITSVEMILEDITKIKELKDQISSLKRIDLINNITKGLLHSFNNTINVIMNKTQMILQITEKESVIEGIQLIEDTANEIISQIRRFNNFIAKDADNQGDISEPLINIIEDAIEFFRLQFKVEEKEAKRSITIERKYFSNIYVTTNTKLLRELIISSILKVSDFISASGIIQIILKENGDLTIQIRLECNEISDDTVASNEYLTSGIDIRQAAEKIGAKIIEEESTGSSSIKIIIPARMIKNTLEKNSDELGYKLRDLDIIIVEDEAALSKILFELFDRMGNRVFICADGIEALEEFKKKHYDIVITDYGIERITGLELAARIKEIDENTVTILLSGWMVDDIPSYKNIVDFFIPKPFKLDDLLKEISKVFLERIRRTEIHNNSVK